MSGQRSGRTPVPPPADARRPPPADASMSLLNDVVQHSADEAYADAAARRSAGSRPARRRSTTLVLGIALLGLLLVVAALQAKDRAPEAAETRDRLIAEIEERTATTDQLQDEVVRLRADVDSARQAALRTTDAGAAAGRRLETLGEATGVEALVGPGVQVTVDDADQPEAGESRGGSTFGEGRILDYDLQRLVNGLWAAGAEAIAIDGQRLTNLSAIRSAGDAILVDYRPLRPPYDVRALGDPQQLEPAFVDAEAGRYLRTLEEAYGIRFDVSTHDELTLPGASAFTLRQARPQGETE